MGNEEATFLNASIFALSAGPALPACPSIGLPAGAPTTPELEPAPLLPSTREEVNMPPLLDCVMKDEREIPSLKVEVSYFGFQLDDAFKLHHGFRYRYMQRRKYRIRRQPRHEANQRALMRR
jgi:hypothetical protein